MKFSIIVPVYNAEKHLKKTLERTLQQNNNAFEIVLVDDGSSDGSGQICDEFANRYPEKVRVLHQENQGQLAARCHGIAAAKGEYCLFLDSDDALQENCLNEMQILLQAYNAPDLLIYSFRYISEDGSSRPALKLSAEAKLYSDKSELYEQLFTSTLLNNVWTKLVKREVLVRCEIDVEKYKHLRCSEDRLHSMEILTQAETVLYTPREWYNYRLWNGSTTRQYTPQAIDRFNDSALYEITGEYLKKWQMDTPEWRYKMDAGWVNGMIYVFNQFYLQCKDKKGVLEFNWQSFLPKTVLENYRNNTELNQTKKDFTGWILGKKKAKIDWYVRKRETKKKLKALLRYK